MERQGERPTHYRVSLTWWTSWLSRFTASVARVASCAWRSVDGVVPRRCTVKWRRYRWYCWACHVLLGEVSWLQWVIRASMTTCVSLSGAGDPGVWKKWKGKAKTARAESKLDAGESKISDKWFRICQDGCKRTSICIVRWGTLYATVSVDSDQHPLECIIREDMFAWQQQQQNCGHDIADAVHEGFVNENNSNGSNRRCYKAWETENPSTDSNQTVGGRHGYIMCMDSWTFWSFKKEHVHTGEARGML